MSGTEEVQQPKYVDFSEYILFQVRRTQSLIRQTDLMLLIASVVSVVLFLLIGFILLDHWAFSQGLSHPLRWLGFWGITGSILSAIIYYWQTTAGKTITRLFAARTLEKADSNFDNNLMTLIDLQANDKETSPFIQSSLEKRAALTLNDLDIEHVVDRKALLHRLYALLIGTVLIFGYAFLTPKSVSDSVWRIMFPWTTATAPTTTQIFDVEPGNVTVTAGTHVEVSAYIDGKIPEAVWLVYSTEDRRIIDERVQMQETEDGLGKFVGIINGENGRGVDQPTSYYLLAGDGRSTSYQIAVRPAPHTTIREVQIIPPAYTKRAPRIQQTGSLDAIEGSAITLGAESNIPIKKSWIQLYDTEDPSSRSGQLPLTISDEKQITGDWKLRIRDDGTYPRFYRIECETADGSRDPSPPLHAILVRPDERPEIRLIDPTSDLVRPINVTVPLLIEAFDPDFLLSGLSIQVEKQGKIIASELIDAHDKQSLRTRYPLELQRLPIKPGDEISFWVEARDNRQPHPNRRNTSKLRIRILDRVDEQQAKKQEEEDKQKQKEIEKKRNEEQDNPATEDPADEENPETTSSDNSEQGTDEAMQKDSPESGEPSETGNNNENSDKTSESNENKNSENTGDKPQQSGKPGDDSEKKSNPKPGEKGEKNPDNNSDSNSEKRKSDEPQFSPDGDDDDQVLKKMIDKMQEKEQQNQKKQSNDPANPDQKKPADADANPSDPKNEQTPKDGTKPENPSSEKPDDKNENNPQEKPQQNGDKNPEQKMNDKQPGDESEQKQPGDKNETKQPGEKEDSQKEPGEKKNDEKPGDDKSKPSQQKGTEPGEKSGDQDNETMQKTPSKNEKPGEDPKPGQGDKPDPNSKDSSQKPRQPEPGEKTDGEMKPGKKPGKGESTPGKGDEKGPTELEKKKPGEQPPQSQNPSKKPGDEKSGKPGKPGDQKSAKPGEKPADAPGKKNENENENENKNPPEKMGNKPTDSENKPTQKPGEKPNGTKQTPEKNPSGNKPPKPGKKNENKPEGKPTADKPNSEKPDQKGGDKKNQQKNKGDDKGGDKSKGDKPGEKPGKGKSDKPGKGSGKSQQSNKPPSEAGEPSGKGGSGNKPGAPHTDKPGSATSGPGGDKQGKPNAQSQQGGSSDSGEGEDQYSLDDRKKAAELVLDKLEKELKRGEVDSELLEELGWDKDNLKQFQQRLADYLRHQKEEGEPNLKEKQFEEMLKNMRLTGKGKSRSGSDAGTTSSDEFAPVITPPPPEYRDISQAFKKSLSKSKSKQPK